MRALVVAMIAVCGVGSGCSVESIIESTGKAPDAWHVEPGDECSVGSNVESAGKAPDPRHVEISPETVGRLLDDARQHAAARRYPEALRSITAYHYGARHAVGQGGVRLSYAIDEWYNLAKCHPPAMAAFLRARDEAAEAVLDDTYCGDDFDAFSDVSAINERLGQRKRTAELFLQIADRDASRAKSLYLVAESELVVAGFYRQANPFLDPEGKLRSEIQAAEGLREYRKGQEPDLELERFERDHRTREMATLVALLVANGRDGEAIAFVKKAKAAFPGQALDDAMDGALTGRFPGQDP